MSGVPPINPFAPTPKDPLHQIALFVVDYLVSTGALKDAEALRREGELRERKRQRAKAKKKRPVKASKKKAKR